MDNDMNVYREHLGGTSVVIEAPTKPSINSLVSGEWGTMRVASAARYNGVQEDMADNTLWICTMRPSARWELTRQQTARATGTTEELRELMVELSTVDNDAWRPATIERALQGARGSSITVTENGVRLMTGILDSVIEVNELDKDNLWSIVVGIIRLEREELE